MPDAKPADVIDISSAEVIDEPLKPTQALTPAVEKTALERRPAFRLVPTSYVEAIEMAKMIAGSGLCPKNYVGKYQDVLIAFELGSSVGLSWIQSLQYIAVVNGRPAIWGDALLALVMPVLEKFEETSEGTWDHDDYAAVCVAKRKGWPNETRRTFSIADAKKAGLWTKDGPWKTYPKRMLQMRARGFCLHDCASDRLMGLVLVEEAQDLPAIDLAPQADGSFGLDLVKQLPQATQDVITKGFALLQLSPAQQRVLVNQFLNADGDQRPLIERGTALHAHLQKEYGSRAKELKTAAAPAPDNGRSPTPAVDASQSGPVDRPSDASSPASSTAPAASTGRPSFDASF